MRFFVFAFGRRTLLFLGLCVSGFFFESGFFGWVGFEITVEVFRVVFFG